ncbi:protein dispatched-like [Oppia nitens]|uniref:protein dispatched-like n=1 Tax=Oppia nitens TaxID=1686743 RepID=UPI0023DC14DC|nr:protein dispatched-like [Oppia nitens]
MWWSRFVERHPILILVVVLAINWSLIAISIVNNDLPTFSDPLLGFEVRGSEISKRINSWKLLLENTSGDIILSIYSKNDSTYKKLKTSEIISEEEELKDIENFNSNAFLSRTHNLKSNETFCGPIHEDYVQFIIQSVDGNDLFTLESIKTLCHIDRQLLRMRSSSEKHLFEDKCETRSTGQCCKSWSLHNYVALIANRKTCDDIREIDLMTVKHYLESCSPYYHNLELSQQCYNEPKLCRKAPKRCFQWQNAVFNLLHYIIDKDFMNPLMSNKTQIKYTSIFLPMAKSTQLLQYYNHLMSKKLQMNGLEVIAMDLGLKYTLFDEYLIYDTIFLMIAFCVILLSLYIYTTSIMVTLVTLLTIITSLGSAYFFYTTIFRIPFFPFMNLLALIIAVGIGSDNALIYCKVWQSAKCDKSSPIFIKLIHDTLSHTWVSVLAASATTGLAFFAGYFSDITSLKCFSLFASTAIAANFVLTMLLLPSAVIISEKYSLKYLSFSNFWRFRSSISKLFFEKMLLNVIMKYRYIIVVLVTSITLTSVVVVVITPGLKLPNSQELQIFSSNHYFEKYDLQLKNKFWFKYINNNREDSSSYSLPIRVVFGIDPQDTGDYLNPSNRGLLQINQNFDITSQSSQLWLIDFCKELRNQSFYKPMMGPLLSNCFIETFKSWMEDRECIDAINGLDRSPCCRTSQFPFKPTVFNLCLNQVIELLSKTPNYFVSHDWAGPRYDKRSLQMVAAVIEYDSVYSFSHSFVEMNRFWNEINDWVSNKIISAPKGLQNGWFISSQMDFYALQLSLSDGIFKSISFAVFFAFVSLIITTCDWRLSALSIITIFAIIFTTIAVLVALDWKLNVLESISILLAIGLAIDFTLHYTIAFKLSKQQENTIQYPLSRIASPVAMAALTTCIAGIAMLFSTILAYIQIGTFLIVLSSISWIYSTFFHLSLLSIFGVNYKTDKNEDTVYCCFICNKSSNTVNSMLMNSPFDSISSDSKPKTKKKRSIRLTLSSTSFSSTSPTQSTVSAQPFQCQIESHELQHMVN